MTCAEFTRRADRHLTRDEPYVDRDPVWCAHAASCGRCARWWRSIRALHEMLAAPAPAADDGRLAARRLRQVVAERGRPAVRFGSVETPVGRLYVALSPRGVYDVTFDGVDDDRYVARLARRACDVEFDHAAVAAVADELRAYCAGTLTRFTVPVDLSGVTDFTARVLRAAGEIPFGQLRTYGALARHIGAPRASRAVGGALGRNPVPILIPCHRVVAGSGGLGGFTGGLPMKRALLRLEGHVVTTTAVG